MLARRVTTLTTPKYRVQGREQVIESHKLGAELWKSAPGWLLVFRT